MRPSARTLANRRNARASTGPKTPAGKARVATNTLRHGLAIPVAMDPAVSEEIDRLSRLIAGEGAGVALLECARRVAEAQVDVLRVRRARYLLLADPQARRREIDGRRIILICSRMLRGRPIDAADMAFYQEFTAQIGKPTPPPSLAEGLDLLAAKLARLERYERRALSRRKFAIREFDLARAGRGQA